MEIPVHCDGWIVDADRSPRGKGKKSGVLHEIHPRRVLARVRSGNRATGGEEDEQGQVFFDLEK